jgi:hypothetical protein
MLEEKERKNISFFLSKDTVCHKTKGEREPKAASLTYKFVRSASYNETFEKIIFVFASVVSVVM